ncbi:hypothetical protein EG834_07815, partial [bacterium]|nr:hypothetical protein [bacterium]
MERRLLKYVAYYDTPSNASQGRTYALSATNKMDYLLSVLNRIGYEVEIISASHTRGSRSQPGKVIRLPN